MDLINIGKKVIILDLKTIKSKMSYNKDMEKLIGKTAKVISYSKNGYDGKYYYKIDLDQEKNTWCSEWLKTN